MLLFDGCAADATETLAGEWCGDLLQIVSDIPEGYKKVDCCFAEIWSRAEYCYSEFEPDNEGFLLFDNEGKRFLGVKLSLRGKRGALSYIRTERSGDTVRFVPVAISDLI